MPPFHCYSEMFLYPLCYCQLINVHKYERSEFIYNNVLSIDLCFVTYVICYNCLRMYLFISCLISVTTAVLCVWPIFSCILHYKNVHHFESLCCNINFQLHIKYSYHVMQLGLYVTGLATVCHWCS